MFRGVVLACVLALASVQALEVEPAAPSFSLSAGTVPALIMQQEVMRRVADIFLGFSGATHFQLMASNEMLSWQSPDAEFVKYDFYNEQDLIDEEFGADDGLGTADLFQEVDRDEVELSLLERRSTTKELEFVPFMGQTQTQTQTPPQDADFEELQHRGALEKLHALKFLQMQIALAASDVDKAYWMNKLLATSLPPQMLTWKVYKNYLSTLALSFMIQLHDSFSQEAFQDEFNDHYGQIVRGSSFVTEAYAEHKTYTTWYYLAVLKFQLFFVNMYEQVAMQRAAGQPTGSGSSFLETELKTQPSIGGNPQGMMVTYAFVSYFVYVLKFYNTYLELMLAGHGSAMGTFKIQAYLIHKGQQEAPQGTDADKLIEQAKDIDSKYLPGLMSSWATVNQWRFMLEFYVLFLDTQMPMMAAASMTANTENAVQGTNFVQTEKPELH